MSTTVAFLGQQVPVVAADLDVWVQLDAFLRALPIGRSVRRRIAAGTAGKTRGITWIKGEDGLLMVRLTSAETIIDGLVAAGAIAKALISEFSAFSRECIELPL